MGVFEKIFGTRSQREIKKIQPTVDKILALEDEYKALSEEALKAKTAEFKNRLDQGETLDDLLPEAFAAVREAADRVLGMRPYPVQLIGGVVLHQGRIAEMKTGEGKTLVAILPCYLNALTGKGVHVVTVNEYLAKRDSEWMGKVYRYMGLTVGLVIPGMSPAERRVAYAADITYCTNNELGFDYLRDNMAIYKSELVQRGHAFAIVDEVDSILIDEARTPLIISGKGEDSSKLYEMADHFVSTLRRQVFAKTDEKEIHDDYDCDYIVDEKQRTVSLTASGIAKAEKFFGVENLADAENATLSHHINQAMKARGLMKRDIDYVIKDGQVIIVDEFTGRHVRPPVQRGPASGHRGQGGRDRRGGEQDPGHHHLPEFLPALRQALRHDRHRADRGRGVQRHLQSGRGGNSHQPSRHPYRPPRRSVQDRSGPAGDGVPRKGSARAGWYNFY